ncbi:hypothetical protein IC582_016886 [Cucumis melo]
MTFGSLWSDGYDVLFEWSMTHPHLQFQLPVEYDSKLSHSKVCSLVFGQWI